MGPDLTETFRAGEHVFTGTIEGLGSGTLTYSTSRPSSVISGMPRPRSPVGPATSKGRTGAVLKTNPADPGDRTTGTYAWNISVPPKGSLDAVNATGTRTTVEYDLPPARTDSARHRTSRVRSSAAPEDPARGGETPEVSSTAVSSCEFTGTIDGLGTGTMTYDRFFVRTAEGENWFDVVTGGTGDFEGITGTGQNGPKRVVSLHPQRSGESITTARRPMRSELRLGPHVRPARLTIVRTAGRDRSCSDRWRRARRATATVGSMSAPAARRRRPARLAEPAHARFVRRHRVLHPEPRSVRRSIHAVHARTSPDRCRACRPATTSSSDRSTSCGSRGGRSSCGRSRSPRHSAVRMSPRCSCRIIRTCSRPAARTTTSTSPPGTTCAAMRATRGRPTSTPAPMAPRRSNRASAR